MQLLAPLELDTLLNPKLQSCFLVWYLILSNTTDEFGTFDLFRIAVGAATLALTRSTSPYLLPLAFVEDPPTALGVT
jgi:hypothetical protein